MNDLNDGITINNKEVIQYINNLQVNKIEYSGYREILVKDRASEITYYLDNEGKCYKIKKDNKYSITNYISSYIGCRELVSSSYDNLYFTNNLIENPMFNLTESSPFLKWYFNPSNQNIRVVKGYEYLGVKTLKLITKALTNYAISQNVRASDLTHTEQYFFTCLFIVNQ